MLLSLFNRVGISREHWYMITQATTSALTFLILILLSERLKSATTRLWSTETSAENLARTTGPKSWRRSDPILIFLFLVFFPFLYISPPYNHSDNHILRYYTYNGHFARVPRLFLAGPYAVWDLSSNTTCIMRMSTVVGTHRFERSKLGHLGHCPITRFFYIQISLLWRTICKRFCLLVQ